MEALWDMLEPKLHQQLCTTLHSSASLFFIISKEPPRKSAESLEMWKLRCSVPSPSFVTTSLNERHSTLFFLPPCLHCPRAGTSGRSKDLFASHQVPKNTKNNLTDCLTLGGIPCCAKKSYYWSLGHLWPRRHLFISAGRRTVDGLSSNLSGARMGRDMDQETSGAHISEIKPETFNWSWRNHNLRGRISANAHAKVKRSG